MFKIRKEHMEAFRWEAIRDFENRMVAHVRQCFAPTWEALGETTVRQLIRQGIERAAKHRIVSERDVCKFINLMLVFGADFDELSEWARAILETAGPNDGHDKMRALHEHALGVA